MMDFWVDSREKQWIFVKNGWNCAQGGESRRAPRQRPRRARCVNTSGLKRESGGLLTCGLSPAVTAYRPMDSWGARSAGRSGGERRSGRADALRLSPRRCHALRTETAGPGMPVPALPVVARAALHRWEEPPISGARGSGTVFFSGCPLGCVFCQNEQISRRDFGRIVTVARLREIFGELIAQGAHNINLVNPTHFAHAVARALEEPLPVPVVWNSSGYERLETLRMLEGKVQVYLPDCKYAAPASAGRYSAAPDYPQTARAAILEMYRQTGAPAWWRTGF